MKLEIAALVGCICFFYSAYLFFEMDTVVKQTRKDNLL